ncbi:MAG: sensor histidine kinase [Bacteroidetes bacterium]|nr:sensor histidine kinase [Bacteroidota bacterium]
MLNKVLNIGVHNTDSFYQNRETKILNLFSLITIVGCLIGTLNIYFLGEAYPSVMVIFELVASALIFYLNSKKMYAGAAYLFAISINFALLHMNVLYSSSTGSFLYYFPLIFCIALLHNPNKPKTRVAIFFSLIALSLVCSRLFSFPFIEKANLTSEQNQILFNFNLNLVAFLTVTLVFLVISLINKQYRELTDLVQTVKNDKLTIQNSLREKEVLLAEIQHRVKNNLAVIIGLFNLQKDNSTNEETKQSITEAKNRVLSIAMVHERLYKKDDLSKINLKFYISELIKEIVKSHPLYDSVTIEENIEDLVGDITKAVPIGLIINEAITNSLKHGFVNTQIKPKLSISLQKTFDLICIKINDNGKGFPVNKNHNERSLGLSLIDSLTEQIDGKIYYENKDGGAQVKLTFPI